MGIMTRSLTPPNPKPMSVLYGTWNPTSLMRRMISQMTPAMVKVLQHGALAGVLPQVDPSTGAEIGPARPMEVGDQIKCIQYLMNKVLPDYKEEAVKAPVMREDNEGLTMVTPDKVRTMTREQLAEAIQEQFSPPTPVDAKAVVTPFDETIDEATDE
jgi:hypothetical protein